MFQQNQNNFRNMLDDLSASPGEAAYNKVNAWEKLYLRLAHQPARRKQLWYWAAASLTLIASALFFAGNQTKKTSSMAAGARLQKETFLPDARTVQLKETVVINTILPVHKKEKPAPVLYRTRHDIAAGEPVKTMLPRREVITTAPQIKIQINDVVAVTGPLKNKLSVVHNNELEDEDRMASQNSTKIKSTKSDNKSIIKTGYAGMLNFRIYLKN